MKFNISQGNIEVTVDTTQVNSCLLPSIRADINAVYGNYIGSKQSQATFARFQRDIDTVAAKYYGVPPRFDDFAVYMSQFLFKLGVKVPNGY